MSNEWKDKGAHRSVPILSDIAEAATGIKERHVENPNTGDKKIATVGPNEKVGDASREGHLKDDDC